MKDKTITIDEFYLGLRQLFLSLVLINFLGTVTLAVLIFLALIIK